MGRLCPESKHRTLLLKASECSSAIIIACLLMRKKQISRSAQCMSIDTRANFALSPFCHRRSRHHHHHHHHHERRRRRYPISTSPKMAPSIGLNKTQLANTQ